jgi:5-deoxy-glucuronate isomerase
MTAAYRGAHVGLDILTVDAGERVTLTPPAGQEAVAVLLTGSVEWMGTTASRKDVFTERASAAYFVAPLDVAAHERTEIAFATTLGYADGNSDTILVTPNDVVAQERGRPPWQRTVHDIVADNVPAAHLIVGETFNESGQWSSFPPHKHDGRDGEPALEEVYYYRFDQPAGFGFQGLYDADGNETAVFLRHGRVVGIPHGYHPVCAAPGYRLYYLWALVGSPRRLAMHEDPAHRWLHDA